MFLKKINTLFVPCFSFTIKQHQSTYQPQKPSSEQGARCKIFTLPLACTKQQIGPVWHDSTSQVKPFLGFSSMNGSSYVAEAVLISHLAKQLLTADKTNEKTRMPFFFSPILIFFPICNECEEAVCNNSSDMSPPMAACPSS
jgi:hypothetical protein